MDERMDYCLPPKNALAGVVLKHCFSMVDQMVSKFEPLLYKVGYTHCPHSRFTNRTYGYILEADQWQWMLVLYTAGETVSPAFVEAALIQRYKGTSEK